MNDNKNIASRPVLPEPSLRRLPWYLAYLRMLDNQHVEYVSSTQISKELNVDASQIAKDLSFLNIKGKTRIGYEVSTLVKELVDFLGFKKKHNAVVIGTGSLGGALMQDVGLAQYGLNIVAGFDVNNQLIGTSICGIPIYDINELAERQKEYNVAIAILTVPVEHSQEVADTAIRAGIKAIWNFTPFRIKAPANIVIANTSIYAHLAIIYNRMINNH
ncbi:MAG: redox-sensing transcriptional repressor Rex [Muribaculaceae bacterium]|nr:redox-sensing transcriptional repressor Rex [Muribaculaceae bacterium]MBR3101375.1 redox-sensing transcriptional repressor Rex [Muribaculaceae bacterium]